MIGDIETIGIIYATVRPAKLPPGMAHHYASVGIKDLNLFL